MEGQKIDVDKFIFLYSNFRVSTYYQETSFAMDAKQAKLTTCYYFSVM